MRRYFTSDLHLGSTKILELCKRPFLDNIEMTDKLIANCNEIANDRDDIIYRAPRPLFRPDGTRIGE